MYVLNVALIKQCLYFNKTYSLTYLLACNFSDLTNNLLTELTDGPFDSMTNLQRLYLSGNKLTEIANGLFDSLTSLHYL